MVNNLEDVTTGLVDEVELLDSDDINKEGEWGQIVTCSTEIDQNTEKYAHVNSEAEYTRIVDGVVMPSGSMEFRVTDLEIFKLFGEEENDEIEIDKRQPKFTIKTSTEEGKHNEFSDAVFTGFSFNVARESPMTLSVDWMAQSVEPKTTSLSPESPDERFWTDLDVFVEIDGSKVGIVDDFSIDMDREGAEHRRGISDKAETDRRGVDYIKLGLIDLTLDMSMEITDDTAWDECDFEEDTRSDKDITLKFGEEDKEIEVTGRFSVVSDEKADDADERIADLTGEIKENITVKLDTSTTTE